MAWVVALKAPTSTEALGEKYTPFGLLKKTCPLDLICPKIHFGRTHDDDSKNFISEYPGSNGKNQDRGDGPDDVPAQLFQVIQKGHFRPVFLLV